MQARHKRKHTYTVMIVPNNVTTGKTKQYSLRKLLWIWSTAIVLVIALLCVAYTYSFQYIYDLLPLDSKKASAFEAKQLDLENQISNLLEENDELKLKVNVLTSAVTKKDEKLDAALEEQAQQVTPTGFPLDGTAIFVYSGDIRKINEDEQEAEEGNVDAAQKERDDVEYISIFEANQGISVVATANGVVTSVEADAEYGYAITIDHGNGYVSIYKNSSEPKVREKTEVFRGSALFELKETQKVGYQIKLDGKYIDPEELMEIFG